jgi:hypothetical protein
VGREYIHDSKKGVMRSQFHLTRALAQLHVGFFFAPNFIQNLYTVLKKRLWETRSTPTLVAWITGEGRYLYL